MQNRNRPFHKIGRDGPHTKKESHRQFYTKKASAGRFYDTLLNIIVLSFHLSWLPLTVSMAQSRIT